MKMARHGFTIGLLILFVGIFSYVFVFTMGKHVQEHQAIDSAAIPSQDVRADGNVDETTVEPQSEERSFTGVNPQESTNEAGQIATVAKPETPAGKDARAMEELASDFERAIAQYNTRLEQARPSSRSATPTIIELAEMDEVFQQLLKSYLASGRTPVQARRELSALVGWVEIPRALGLGGRAKVSLDIPGYETESLEDGYDTKPLVLWRDVPRKEGGPMMVCQGAYVVANSTKRFRVRMTPYSVLESLGDPQVTYLHGDEERPWYPGNSVMFLDAYDVGEALPVVGLMAGPSGNAGALRFYANRFDREKGAWVLWDGDEWEKVSTWEYSATSKILAVYGYDKLKGENYETTLNVADRVAKRLELKKRE